ncbi:TUBD1 (predicted) [Pycnogonum litorale]
MSIVTVQVGQCGNQVGRQFFSTLMNDINAENDLQTLNDYQQTSIDRFFTVPDDCNNHAGTSEQFLPVARAVLVDMEKKVVDDCFTRTTNSKHSVKSNWTYSDRYKFVRSSGAANNWANGYQVCGPLESDRIMDLIRQQVEHCDRMSGFLIPMSVAGGTGAGIGTFLTQKIRDSYPECFVVNQVFCPYSSGDNVIQNYNAILTLSHLQQSSDGILVHRNDVLSKAHNQLVANGQSKNIQHEGFDDVNTVASQQLCSILQPAFFLPSSSSATNGTKVISPLGNLINDLCSLPDFKFMSVASMPYESNETKKYSSYSWHGLTKQLLKQCRHERNHVRPEFSVKDADPSSKSKEQFLNRLLITRGKGNHGDVIEQFGSDKSGTLKVWCQSRPFVENDKFCTLVHNGQIHQSFKRMTENAWNMFRCDAYTHQYYRYGWNKDDFINSFASMEQIIRNYNDL